MDLYKHPELPVYSHTWDWKEQPNWRAISTALEQIPVLLRAPFFYEVDTNGDCYAVLISAVKLPEGKAEELYAEMWNGVDWEAIGA